MAKTADRIANLPNVEIENIVKRISELYMPYEKGRLILSNLLSRKDTLRQIVKPK
jgi:hypothetical protein